MMPSMEATPLDQPHDLVIVGIPCRTSPASAARDVPAHWQRFSRQDVAARVGAIRRGDHVYAVYCDYETDDRGPYTMVLGLAVQTGSPVLDGLRRVRVPAGRYVRFQAKGDPATALWTTWSHVNGVWADRGRRRYIADFERYAGSTTGPIEADVVVGVE
jgi:predicted transcriptional regulator YdeE